MTDDPRNLLLDIVGSALKAKLAVELGRGRLARQTLAELVALIASVRPAIDTLAMGATDYDVDLCLADLLAERHPASVLDTAHEEDE